MINRPSLQSHSNSKSADYQRGKTLKKCQLEGCDNQFYPLHEGLSCEQIFCSKKCARTKYLGGCHCTQKQCRNQAFCRGLCVTHYNRWRYKTNYRGCADKIKKRASAPSEWKQRYNIKRREKIRELRKSNPEIFWAKNLWRHYRMTLSDYYQRLKKQKGLCAICKLPPRGTPKGKRLCVDHDHKTGKVRGLVCHSCNRRLGWFDTYKLRIMRYV